MRRHDWRQVGQSLSQRADLHVELFANQLREAYRQCLITLGKHAIYIEFELSPARLKRYPRYSTIACNRLADIGDMDNLPVRKTGGVREATERAGDNSFSCCPLQVRLQ